MNRIVVTSALLLATVLLQSLVFDKLTLGLSLTPLVYIVFIVLQPLQRSQLEMICWGFLLGVAMDMALGMAGINTIATLAVSYLRIYILNTYMSKDAMSLGGVPLIYRVGATRLSLYAVTMVALHSAIYFGLESMNFASIEIVAGRFAASLLLTLLFTWLSVVLAGVAMFRYSD